MTTCRATGQWQLGVAIAGLGLWLTLVAWAERDALQPSASSYLAAVFLVGVHAGFLRWPLWRTLILMFCPVLVVLPFTAPRGDEDGLWLLWYPTVVGGALMFGVVPHLASRISDLAMEALTRELGGWHEPL